LLASFSFFWRRMLRSWWLFLIYNDSGKRTATTTTTTTSTTTAMGFLLESSPPPLLLLRQRRNGRPSCASLRYRRLWLVPPACRHQQQQHIHAMLPFSIGDTISIGQQPQLMMMPSILTVPATTTLLTPILALGALPYGALVYFLDRLQTFPKGAVVGFAWVFLLGLCAGPADFFTQSTYDGTSFFDCDWVHGTISSLFATAYTVANVALLLVRRQQLPSVVRPDDDGDGGDNEQQGGGSAYGPALRYCTAVTSAIVAIAVAEYGRGDYGVHSPHWFGVLDHVMPSSTSTLAAIGEPANALSVATWFNHVMELTQFQMLIRSIHQWEMRTTVTSARSNQNQQDSSSSSSSSSSMSMMPRRRSQLAWSLVPLQFANICICDFHLFYNQWAPLYLAFGLLLFVGNSLAAWTVWRLVAADEESAGNSAVDVANMVSTAGSSVAPTAIVVGGRRHGGNRSTVDTTAIVYTVKSLLVGLVGAYAVKYVSVVFLAPCFVPGNNDLLSQAATLVALFAMAVSVWDVRRLE
jgi:hypothetical protein